MTYSAFFLFPQEELAENFRFAQTRSAETVAEELSNIDQKLPKKICTANTHTDATANNTSCLRANLEAYTAILVALIGLAALMIGLGLHGTLKNW